MKLLNRKGRFLIHHTPDGGYDKCLTTEIPTLSASRRTIRELMKMGFRFQDLSIEDVDTGRYISFCI